MSCREVVVGCLALVLGGCGARVAGSDGGLAAADAGPWAEAPAGAQQVSAEELAGLADAGELRRVLPGDTKAQAEARAASAAADEQVVEALLAKHPALGKRLLKPFGSQAKVLPDGNLEVQLPLPDGGSQLITTLGSEQRAARLADTWRRFNTVKNQVLLYQALQPRLPDDCLAGLPDPATVEALSLEALLALNRGAAKCWRDSMGSFTPPAGAGPAALPAGPADYEGASSAASPFIGDTGCSAQHLDAGLWAAASWPSKNFDSNVKNQGRRGSCSAFGLVGAMENSIAHTSGHFVNLSEQALYAKAKLDWKPDDFQDGLNTYATADHLVDEQWAVPFESAWPYNPSPYRVPCKAPNYCGASVTDDPTGYWKSCDATFSGVVQYAGPACSDTVHQAKEVYHGEQLSYWTPKHTNDGYTLGQVVELDDLEDAQSGLLATAMMSMGYGVVISFDVYDSFRKVPPTGMWDPPNFDDEDVGSHAVEASGVIFNQHLPANLRGAGGGWVVVKNSWGCWGESGYVYMSFAAASEVMSGAMAVLPKRLGTNARPTISFSSEPPRHLGNSGTTSSTWLYVDAADAEDVLTKSAVTWTVTPGGQTTTGTYLVFTQGPGSYLVTATVIDSEGKKASVSATIVVDPPPVPVIAQPVANATILRGAQISVEGSASTVTSLTGVPCANLTWSSSKADAIDAKTGCSLVTSFTTNGARTLTLRAVDAEGGSASTTVNVTVVDPPPTGPPVITLVTPAGTLGSPYAVGNPGLPVTFNASLQVPGNLPDCPPGAPNCVTYLWSARQVGATAFNPIGNSHTIDYTPKTGFPGGCGATEIEVQLCATTPGGTGCRSTFLSLLWGPC